MRPRLLLVLGILITACGRDNPAAPRLNISVSVTPEGQEIVTARTTQFHAEVTGSSRTDVVWSIDEGPSHGLITSQGYYTAPEIAPSPATATIRATSAAEPARSAFVRVSIIQGLIVRVTPVSPVVSGGGDLQLSVDFEFGAPQAIDWSVVGGAASGTVSSSGLYRAPESVTAGSTAIVEARSLEEPDRLGRAIISLVPPPPAGEPQILTDMYQSGYLASRLSDQVTALVVEALVTAFELNGRVPATTGLLTERDGRFEYTPDPASTELIVDPGSAPVTRITVHDVTFDYYAWGFQGRPGRYGYEFQGDLAARVVQEGRMDIELTNESARAEFIASPGNVCDKTQFNRTIRGNALLNDSEAWSFDVAHEGEIYFCSDGFGGHETVTGEAGSPRGATLTLTETLELSSGGNWAFNGSGGAFWSWKPNVHASWNGATYDFQDVEITGEYFLYAWYSPGSVSRIETWRATGLLSRDGSPYGSISFQGPVELGSRGTSALMSYGYGHRFVLQDPGVPEDRMLIQNPFFNGPF